MKEYIERAAVETMLENAQIITDGENCGYCTEDVNLGSIPAADVAEVRHGRWFFKYPNGWACSRCGEWGLMIDNRGICKSSYCPNCGALMKEDEHEAG